MRIASLFLLFCASSTLLAHPDHAPAGDPDECYPVAIEFTPSPSFFAAKPKPPSEESEDTGLNAPGDTFTPCIEGTLPALPLTLGQEVHYANYPGPKRKLFHDRATYVEIQSYVIRSQQLVQFHLDPQAASLTVYNWLPRDLQRLQVVTKGPQARQVFTLDRLPGLQALSFRLPPELLVEGIEFDFVPCDDLQRSLKAIKPDWTMVFQDRYMGKDAERDLNANTQWRPLRPQDCRYLLTFMIHAAQTVSEPRFSEYWMCTPFQRYTTKDKKIAAEDVLTQAEFQSYPDAEKKLYSVDILKQGGYYNKKHRAMVLGRYMKKFFRLGIVGGGGLGGGSTLGINHARFIGFCWNPSPGAAALYDRNEMRIPMESPIFRETPWNIFGHECGHALGFSHDDTYCVRSEYSHIAIGTIIYSWLQREKKLFITAQNMTGRDPSWEGEYDKYSRSLTRSRPALWAPFEWGGVYGRNNYVTPKKETAEWAAYLVAHKKGLGLEYIKAMPVNQLIDQKSMLINDKQWKTFIDTYQENPAQAVEYLRRLVVNPKAQQQEKDPPHSEKDSQD